MCFLPNTCVGLGAKVLSNLEIRNDGLTFSNFASPLSLDDEFNMGWVVLMLFIDTVLFMTLYWLVSCYLYFILHVSLSYLFFYIMVCIVCSCLGTAED